MTGTKQQVSITTTPTNAEVSVNEHTGRSPFTVLLKKGRSYKVRAEQEGYLPAHATIGKSFNPAFLGNLLLGGLIGMAVDIGTGAWMNLDNDVIHLTLQKK